MTRARATEILAAHYEQTFSAHGANADGVDWGCREKHQLRLERMVNRVGVERIRAQPLLDVGCGYGELLSVLSERFGVRPLHYVGVDPCLPMIESARTSHPEHRFEAVAFEDYVPSQPIEHLFCCGLFTKKVHANDEEMYALLDTFLDYGKNMASRTITFNTMSPLCDIRSNDLFFPQLDRVISRFEKYWGYGIREYSFSCDYLRYEMLIHLEV